MPGMGSRLGGSDRFTPLPSKPSFLSIGRNDFPRKRESMPG
jgi:hypothetical protein